MIIDKSKCAPLVSPYDFKMVETIGTFQTQSEKRGPANKIRKYQKILIKTTEERAYGKKHNGHRIGTLFDTKFKDTN